MAKKKLVEIKAWGRTWQVLQVVRKWSKEINTLLLPIPDKHQRFHLTSDAAKRVAAKLEMTPGNVRRAFLELVRKGTLKSKSLGRGKGKYYWLP